MSFSFQATTLGWIAVGVIGSAVGQIVLSVIGNLITPSVAKVSVQGVRSIVGLRRALLSSQLRTLDVIDTRPLVVVGFIAFQSALFVLAWLLGFAFAVTAIFMVKRGSIIGNLSISGMLICTISGIYVLGATSRLVGYMYEPEKARSKLEHKLARLGDVSLESHRPIDLDSAR
jgi:large-conductance mechanosensitive channel